MPAPPKRRPRTSLAGDELPTQVNASPDNGVPYGVTARARRNGRQLGYRVPEEVYQRLLAASHGTDIALGRIVLRAIEAELKRLNY